MCGKDVVWVGKRPVLKFNIIYITLTLFVAAIVTFKLVPTNEKKKKTWIICMAFAETADIHNKSGWMQLWWLSTKALLSKLQPYTK